MNSSFFFYCFLLICSWIHSWSSWMLLSFAYLLLDNFYGFWMNTMISVVLSVVGVYYGLHLLRVKMGALLPEIKVLLIHYRRKLSVLDRCFNLYIWNIATDIHRFCVVVTGSVQISLTEITFGNNFCKCLLILLVISAGKAVNLRHAQNAFCYICLNILRCSRI